MVKSSLAKLFGAPICIRQTSIKICPHIFKQNWNQIGAESHINIVLYQVGAGYWHTIRATIIVTLWHRISHPWFHFIHKKSAWEESYHKHSTLHVKHFSQSDIAKQVSESVSTLKSVNPINWQCYCSSIGASRFFFLIPFWWCHSDFLRKI